MNIDELKAEYLHIYRNKLGEFCTKHNITADDVDFNPEWMQLFEITYHCVHPMRFSNKQ